ncbi:hypothetical protein PG993_007182 [Apiospora rasikravindrae]|uniref:Dimethylaniline monooxygenase n=1 Tax=Apiospora rasikravindrae TaxID=990691 RepID=A0ABR1SWS5_9PEZI
MLRVAVIGGGPAGLATLKFLKTAHQYFGGEPVDAILFEAAEVIGGTFVNKVYEDAELVSSKYLTTFSDYRLGPEYPDFVTPEQYVMYLQRYCEEFNLVPHLHCGVKVVKVTRQLPSYQGAYTLTVEYRNDGHKEYHYFDAVAICNGLHNQPADPRIPGLNKALHSSVLHSSEVKDRQDFFKQGPSNLSKSGPHVAILGAGETAMDIAHLAITTPGVETVMLCHKNGFFVAPKKIPEPTVFRIWHGSNTPKPIDTAVASLFDTAYCHPKLQRGSMLWSYYTWVVQLLMYIATGTRFGMDQWAGEYAADRFHIDGIFLVKSVRSMPYISWPWRKKTVWQSIRAFACQMPIQDARGRRIQLAPWPTHVRDDGTWAFPDRGRPEDEEVKDMKDYKPTVVVCCTGYDRSFPFLDHDFQPTLDHANVRGVYCSDDVTVGYIGFVRPNLGAIPPLAELQAQLWVLRLMQWAHSRGKVVCGNENSAEAEEDGKNSEQSLQQCNALFAHDPNAVEAYEISYWLRPRGEHDLAYDKGGVDHESYAYQLALDLGAAPTLSFMVRQGPRAFWTWAMGSNFNPKFRLVGPWANRPLALGIMRGELFKITSRLGGFVFFFWYSLVPFVGFGAMSLGLYAWDFVKGLFV